MARLENRSWLRAMIVVLAATFLCGCVYLRLLQLKRQLAQFDENFSLVESEDFQMRCLHPVLTGNDLRWLGAHPCATRPWGEGTEWTVRWVKAPPTGVVEKNVYDMEFVARLSNDRLAEAIIPKRYFEYFPKELFVNLLRSTGTARVNREEKQAEATTESPPKMPVPNLKDVKGMLGEPTQQFSTAQQTTYFFSYRLDLPDPPSPPIEMTFTFDTKTGNLRRMIARLPRGTLKYDFPDTGNRNGA